MRWVTLNSRRARAGVVGEEGEGSEVGSLFSIRFFNDRGLLVLWGLKILVLFFGFI